MVVAGTVSSVVVVVDVEDVVVVVVDVVDVVVEGATVVVVSSTCTTGSAASRTEFAPVVCNETTRAVCEGTVVATFGGLDLPVVWIDKSCGDWSRATMPAPAANVTMAVKSHVLNERMRFIPSPRPVKIDTIRSPP